MKRFLQRILQEIMKKKIIFGTSDAWWMSRLSQRPSDPAYYIEDCRILALSWSASIQNSLLQSCFCIVSTFLIHTLYIGHDKEVDSMQIYHKSLPYKGQFSDGKNRLRSKLDFCYLLKVSKSRKQIMLLSFLPKK